MTKAGQLAYVQQVLARIAQDKFGQRDAPIVSLSADTRAVEDEGLSGALEVHIRRRTGEVELIHAEPFSRLQSQTDVDDVFARALSVVLMNHAKWPR